MKYVYLLSSIVISVIGQLFLKKGVSSSNLSFNLPSIIKTFFTPEVFFGFVLYGLSAILWLFVLQKFPLTVAYPFLSLTYVIILIAGVFWLQEPLSFIKVVGVILILLGVVLVNR
jgi:multidrug transporter EmrE-like cation transporter